MGNQQSLINYNSQLVFSENLSEQLHEIKTQYHPGLGKIKIWQIKNPNNIRVFSICAHTYEKDSAVNSVHRFRCSLKHKNLISYLACIYQSSGSVETQNYFFEYHTRTLREIIKKGKLSELEIWKYIDQIVDVMEYLQQLKRTHGNLSSDAILLDQDNTVKLLDQLGQKPNYLSIKQDVYDLGLLIIEMMTQRNTQLNFIQALKKLDGEYSCQLLQLVAKLIQKDPLARPDFIELKGLLENRFKVPIIYRVDNFNNPIFNSNTTTRGVSPSSQSTRYPMNSNKQIDNYTQVNPNTEINNPNKQIDNYSQVNKQIDNYSQVNSNKQIDNSQVNSNKYVETYSSMNPNKSIDKYSSVNPNKQIDNYSSVPYQIISQSPSRSINQYNPIEQRCRTIPTLNQRSTVDWSPNQQQVKCNSPNNSRINTTLPNKSTQASPILSMTETFGTSPKQYISKVYTRPWSQSYQQ